MLTCCGADGFPVSRSGLMENIPQDIDIIIDGRRYTGVNTGILAWRNGLQIAPPGGTLCCRE